MKKRTIEQVLATLNARMDEVYPEATKYIGPYRISEMYTTIPHCKKLYDEQRAHDRAVFLMGRIAKAIVRVRRIRDRQSLAV